MFSRNIDLSVIPTTVVISLFYTKWVKAKTYIEWDEVCILKLRWLQHDYTIMFGIKIKNYILSGVSVCVCVRIYPDWETSIFHNFSIIRINNSIAYLCRETFKVNHNMTSRSQCINGKLKRRIHILTERRISPISCIIIYPLTI